MVIVLPDIVRCMAMAGINGDASAIPALYDYLLELGVPVDDLVMKKIRVGGESWRRDNFVESYFELRCIAIADVWDHGFQTKPVSRARD